MKKLIAVAGKVVVFGVALMCGALAVSGENPENLTDSMAKVRQAEEKESVYMKCVQKAEEATGKGDWETAIAFLQGAGECAEYHAAVECGDDAVLYGGGFVGAAYPDGGEGDGSRVGGYPE